MHKEQQTSCAAKPDDPKPSTLEPLQKASPNTFHGNPFSWSLKAAEAPFSAMIPRTNARTH